MKKLLIILPLTALSCEYPTKDATNRIDVGDDHIYTYVIDGCEYIGDLNGDTRDNFLTHKGNCKNKIHNK